MKKWFLNTSEYIVYTFLGIIIIFLLIMSMFVSGVMGYTDEHIFFVKDFAPLMLGGCFVFLALLLFVKNKVTDGKWNFLQEKTAVKSKIKWVVTGIWFLVMFLWIGVTLMDPVADQASVFNAAKHLLEGNFTDWDVAGYMYTFPFQNGLVLLYAAFHAIFGSKAVLAVECFNLLCWYGTIILLCRMIGKTAGETVADWAYYVLLFFFPMWGYVTFVYGTVPGLFFSVLAFWIEQRYEENRNIRYLVWAALAVAFAVMWKSNYEIFMIALAIVLVLHIVRENDWWGFLGIGCIILFFVLFQNGVLSLMHGITGMDTKHGIPMIAWIAMGLNDSNIAPGFYNRFTLLTYEACNYDVAAVKNASIEEIRLSMAQFGQLPDYALNFFLRKLCAIWESPMMEGCSVVLKKNGKCVLSYPVKDILYNGGICNTLLLILMDVVQTLVYLGITLHVWFGKKDLRGKGLIIAFIGGFIFHIFWEGKCQYAIPYFTVMIPVAIQGFGEFLMMEKNAVAKKKCAVKGGLMALLVGIILMAPVQFVKQIRDVGADTAEYIYFATNETEWKEDYFEIIR